MKRMSLYKMICYCCLIWGTMACTKEDTPEAMWEYTGPVPAILDGPSQAQKMCYALYQKYDLHIYYNLSGEEALKTEVGYTQVNGITANNPEAIPMQAADEAVAEKFLTLLTGFFALLPDEMVSSGLYRRQVLVKINPGNNKYKDENGNRIFSNTKTEEMQGILYYGYLDNSQDTDDKFTDNLKGWKWGIFYEFFRGLSYTTYKGIPLPERFGSPFGASATSDYAYADWVSFVAWILTEDRTERETDMKTWSRLQEKYDLVIQYYRQYYQLDLEQIAKQCQKLTVK